MIKTLLQKLIRFINISLFTKSLPLKVSIYFHETYKNDIEDIERIILFFKKEGYEFVTIDNFNRHLDDSNKHFAFTFDDGFEECYTIIAPLLEKYNCRGTFFINANYIESNLEYQDDFNKRIAISSKKPMSWNQVIDLHKRGHIIGSHGLDHYNFRELEPNEIENQIKKNKQILEDKLNYKCDYFAWTYGKRQHFSIKALEITEKYHKYIFSGTNYKNYFSYNGRVLNRRHHEANWPKSHIKYFLSYYKKYNK